jgi:ABC-type glutathione transport system ATPase component
VVRDRPDRRRGGFYAATTSERGARPVSGAKGWSGSSSTDGEVYDVEFRGVTKRFGSITAVNGVDLRVRKGEFLSLLGPSGCGKTTSLRLIAGFEQLDEGEILIGGEDAIGIPP